MKNSMKRKVIAVVTCISLMAVGLGSMAIGAVAEGTTVNAGMETVTLDNGFSMTYDANSFSVYVNPDNSVIAEYLGDLKAGFSIYRSEGLDAEEYMAETAEEYGVDLECAPCFGEDRDWYFYTSKGEEDGVESTDVEYARNNTDGVWFVSTYTFLSGDEAMDTELSDVMSATLNSMTFAD